MRRRKDRLPHHGRGGSRHVGRIRVKLAAILRDCLELECEPEHLQPAGGRQRNNTTISASQFDGYAWEVFTTKRGIPFVAGSFDTMTDCVKAGGVVLIGGEIMAASKSEREKRG